MQTLAREVTKRWPDVGSMGVYNPRHIGSNPLRPWSQHAGCEPDKGWYGNAWDITSPPEMQPKDSSNEEHMAYLDKIYAYLFANRHQLHINELIWRSPSHWNHIHVSTYPKMANDFWRKHPTNGGPVLTIDKDGTKRNTYYVAEEDEPVLAKGDSGPAVKRVQRWINKSPAAPDPPLVADGKFGPATEAGVMEYQQRRGFDVTGVVDGLTYGDLTLWKEGGD